MWRRAVRHWRRYPWTDDEAAKANGPPPQTPLPEMNSRLSLASSDAPRLPGGNNISLLPL